MCFDYIHVLLLSFSLFTLYPCWTDHQDFIGEQFGFVKKRSCLSQLLDTFHSWAKARNDSHKVDVILLDFTLSLVGNKVSFRSHFSPWTMVTSGVPQGSVLGPVLFLPYINDITAGVRSSMCLFADDSKVYRIIYDENDEKQLQCDLNMLHKWSQNWQLCFHPDICEALRITHARDHASFPYKLSGCTLQSVTKMVFWGVSLTSSLSWNAQTQKGVNKANKIVDFLKRNVGPGNKEVFSLSLSLCL